MDKCHSIVWYTHLLITCLLLLVIWFVSNPFLLLKKYLNLLLAKLAHIFFYNFLKLNSWNWICWFKRQAGFQHWLHFENYVTDVIDVVQCAKDKENRQIS